jgi:hypothetical protein
MTFGRPGAEPYVGPMVKITAMTGCTAGTIISEKDFQVQFPWHKEGRSSGKTVPKVVTVAVV